MTETVVKNIPLTNLEIYGAKDLKNGINAVSDLSRWRIIGLCIEKAIEGTLFKISFKNRFRIGAGLCSGTFGK